MPQTPASTRLRAPPRGRREAQSCELTLEQSLQAYEEGVALARRGQQLLATAEKRVEILVSASGKIETVPFDEQNPG